MLGAWTRLEEPEYSAVWDAFEERFQFRRAGGRLGRTIRDPQPSITFDIREIWNADRPGYSGAAADAIEAAARRAFLSEFGEEVELLVLDWQHPAYRLRPAEHAPAPAGGDALLPTVVPDGDYYIYATLDLENGTFGHPWEPSLCVFGSGLTESLGTELRTWLPVLRERVE